MTEIRHCSFSVFVACATFGVTLGAGLAMLLGAVS